MEGQFRDGATIQRSASLGAGQNKLVAGDLQAFSIQQTGRLDYTAVVKQSGQEVWSCEHITHHNPISAMECANREIARRTAPEKHSQK
jgi:hypothetical protein